MEEGKVERLLRAEAEDRYAAEVGDAVGEEDEEVH